MKETETKKRLMEYLRVNTSLELTDCGRWFYACSYSEKDDAPKIAFRADFDGLPIPEKNDLPYCSENEGISHRCGHDGHSAVLAALARTVDRYGADCDVYFIFQHAEEIGGGGEECAQLIEEKHIDRVYAFHNWSGFPEKSIVVGSGAVHCASEGLTVSFTGKPAHASRPEDGNSPVRALAELVTDVPGSVTVVGINAGGDNFGIAPGDGTASFTLRAERESEIAAAERKLLHDAEKLAGKYSLKLELSINDAFPETVNDSDLAGYVKKTACGLGMNVADLDRPIRSSEDFGHFQKKCPGVMIHIGNGENYPHVHTEKYDFNDNIIETAVELFYELVKKEESK